MVCEILIIKWCKYVWLNILIHQIQFARELLIGKILISVGTIGKIIRLNKASLTYCLVRGVQAFSRPNSIRLILDTSVNTMYIVYCIQLHSVCVGQLLSNDPEASPILLTVRRKWAECPLHLFTNLSTQQVAFTKSISFKTFLTG